MYRMHEYEELTADKRPQDPMMDGTGLKFETLEHGGEYPDTMPQAIRLTDADGRSAIYLPIEIDGKVVDSKGYCSDTGDGSLILERVAKRQAAIRAQTLAKAGTGRRNRP